MIACMLWDWSGASLSGQISPYVGILGHLTLAPIASPVYMVGVLWVVR